MFDEIDVEAEAVIKDMNYQSAFFADLKNLRDIDANFMAKYHLKPPDDLQGAEQKALDYYEGWVKRVDALLAKANSTLERARKSAM